MDEGELLRTSVEVLSWKNVLQSSVRVWATEVLAPVWTNEFMRSCKSRASLVLESDGDGPLSVGELVADEDRARWSRWIFVTSLGWKGFRHIGQTLRASDLRHLDQDQGQYKKGEAGGEVARLGINLPQTKHVSTSGSVGSSAVTL